MNEELTDSIYASLPEAARQEAVDFLLFLQQRYGEDEVRKRRNKNMAVARIRNNPGFGMWKDIEQDSKDLLAVIRKEQWPKR